MLRVIREIQPTWVIGENVPGIINLALEDICLALESEGYEVQSFIIPSASIGAWDKRERVWIIAYSDSYSNSNRPGRIYDEKKTKELETERNKIYECNISSQFNSELKSKIQAIYEEHGTEHSDCITVDIISSRREDGLHGRESERQTGECIHNFKESDWWERNWIEVASELCRSDARVSHKLDRIKALGNSVNPYVVYVLFKYINEYEDSLY